jgi:predicted AlkP superfamily pyrophosphatase or phosphodiesterase
MGNWTYDQHAEDKIHGSNKEPTNTKMLKIDDQEYERVKEFQYLGISRPEDNDVTTQSEQRITMANKTSYGLKKSTKLTEFERSD